MTSLMTALRYGRQRTKSFRAVTQKLGLVYFGAVDQHSDDHDVVRGLTASVSHKDRHFSVGTHDGYDIALVDRQDKNSRWCALRVSLHQPSQLPHFFVLPKNREAGFRERIVGSRSLQPVESFLTFQQPAEFMSRYALLGLPQQGHILAEVITSQLLHAIAAHFWPHAIECHEGQLYVYITEHRLDETVVLSALQSALWLASLLDDRAV